MPEAMRRLTLVEPTPVESSILPMQAHGLVYEVGGQRLDPKGFRVENEEQAIVRADPKQGDKGGDAARAALSLFRLSQRGEA